MIVASPAAVGSLREAIATDGFVFVRGAAMRQLLADLNPLADVDAFAASWNDLRLDAYMADGGRYRRRRHAAYAVDAHAIVREPHQPHYQSREYNRLNGGIARWFDPIRGDIGGGATLMTILQFGRALFGELAPYATRWQTEVHQFRIEARPAEPGRPTPEGVHRDGVEYVLVLLVRRGNIAEGDTTIHGPGGESLGSFTLADPFDAALVDDRRVAHGVTPVQPIDPTAPAYRDVLVVTFRSCVPCSDSAGTRARLRAPRDRLS